MEFDLTSPLDPAEVPSEWWEERMRLRRNALLAKTDWTQLADVTISTKQAWATWRQELRDTPQTWTPGPIWVAPEPPEEL